MKSEIAKKIIEETPQSIKDMMRVYGLSVVNHIKPKDYFKEAVYHVDGAEYNVYEDRLEKAFLLFAADLYKAHQELLSKQTGTNTLVSGSVCKNCARMPNLNNAQYCSRCGEFQYT